LGQALCGPTDPDARIARMKDGRTHLAYKPEHAVDLDTGAVLAAVLLLVVASDHSAVLAVSLQPDPFA
jgi:hypothetical protein